MENILDCNTKAKITKRIIIVSWCVLALCFIIKIFGGNWFCIVEQNENYIKLCNYADTHNWLKYVIGVISSFICESLYILAIIQKYKFDKRELIVVIISVMASCLVKLFSEPIGIIFDLWLFIFLPIACCEYDYHKHWAVIIAFVLTLVFQVVSLLVKNLGLQNVGNTYFIGLIYAIDVYIMCFIYYLYRNYSKKEK